MQVSKSKDQPPGEKKGAALITTLAIVSLLSLLVITFFAISQTETTSTGVYADGQTVKRLTDSTVQIVLAQIRDATHGFRRDSSGNSDFSNPVSWSAQPGMIHNFDENGLARVYKLYSSDAMVVNGGSFDPLADQTALNGWEDQPSIYADLNSPVMISDASGNLVPVAPIIDPGNLVPLNGRLTYSSDGATPDIEGFSVAPPNSFRIGEPVSPSNNPVPMPVRWIYLLEDGRMTVPTEDPTGIAKFDRPGNPAPTASNPIVARIAFWTDDESPKVNINTASEGTYWDLPRIWSREDIGSYTGNPDLNEPGLAFGQPAQKEFQRYAGHPATTSLSPVLGKILPRPDSISASTRGYFESYYSLLPRTNTGGSRAGTQIVSAPIPIKDERLFPSVSEFLYAPYLASGGDRSINGPLSAEVIRRSGFFLSAHSGAPETTIFNTPKISIWPVWSDQGRRTAYDQLAAFCSTIGGQAYHFTRSTPRSGTAGVSARNLEIYNWLTEKTGQPIPGYGGDFASKFGEDHKQILTSIYDYIRATNPQDRSDGATPFTPIYNSVNLATPGAGEIVPIRIEDTQGFGRYPALSSPGIMFVGKTGSGARAETMEAVFVAEFATPGHGMACMRSNMKWRVRGLDQLRIRYDGGEWESLRLPEDGTCLIEQGDLDHWGGRGIGGTLSLLTTFRAQARSNKSFTEWGGDSVALNYPFFSELPLQVPTGATENFEFEGGHEIILELITADTGEVVQTNRFVFPEGEFKIPGFAADIRQRNKWRIWEVMRAQDTIIGLEPAGALGNEANEDPDTTAGDKRMLSGLHDVPPERFRAHKDYFTPGVRFAHSFTLTTGPNNAAGNQSGKLVEVPNYVSFGYNRNPDVPPRVGNYVTRVNGAPGEWDTGFGDQPDGAYINKPNDGDSAYDNRQGGGRFRPPYILGYNQGFAAAKNEFFSPNLQVPSPLMFGSLPSGIKRLRPWETLLFHPRPEDSSHPGRATPPDHLLADLFWMPVIEPYAISQPFATSGKINLNYRIQPFDYIRRETGMHAVLKSTRFLALEPTDASRYKPLDPAGRNSPFMPNRRRDVDIEATLAAFDARYTSQGVFRSASEICEMHLVPPGESASSMQAFWARHPLSGDNVREKPYVDIYPRVTTKTNTFTIHYKVQVLRKTKRSAPNEWNDTFDSVVAESRGSAIVERYIDPNDERLPNFASLPLTDPATNLDQYYRFRIVSSSTFQP